MKQRLQEKGLRFRMKVTVSMDVVASSVEEYLMPCDICLMQTSQLSRFSPLVTVAGFEASVAGFQVRGLNSLCTGIMCTTVYSQFLAPNVTLHTCVSLGNMSKSKPHFQLTSALSYMSRVPSGQRCRLELHKTLDLCPSTLYLGSQKLSMRSVRSTKPALLQAVKRVLFWQASLGSRHHIHCLYMYWNYKAT